MYPWGVKEHRKVGRIRIPVYYATFLATFKDVWSLNRHRFQSLKLSKLVADIILHGELKFWTRLPE